MKRVLFLAVNMAPGFGVSVVIEELMKALQRRSIACSAACVKLEGTFAGLDVQQVSPHAEAVRALAREVGADVIVAQTSPFFELLPGLAADFRCWAWEHGDPTPQFFPLEQAARQQVVSHKQRFVYDRIEGVIVSSDFLKHDIDWPASKVIWLAHDHAPARTPKEASDFHGVPIKVGTLMRIGSGEAQYKGNQLFIALARACHDVGLPAEFHVAGRGTASDAQNFTDQGLRVHLNLSEADKYAYLRSLDLFASFSLWEGFNLPLVEAQAMGTLSLALDAGAHPEVCPFVIRSPWEAVAYIRRASEDARWLREQSVSCHAFVNKRFSWQKAADQMVDVLQV